MQKKTLLISVVLVLLFGQSDARNDACNGLDSLYYKSHSENVINPSRFKTVAIAGSGLYIGSVTALYLAWYRNYPMGSFHFFNDSREWMQMDKMGHLTTSYHTGLLGYEALKWAGVDEKRSLWYGGFFGSVFLTTIELFDGFSTGWGASISDLAANTIGSGIFVSQQALWGEQKVAVKYSYHPTRFAAYRPDVLGSNHLERALKDYNGQTVWLSGNLRAFGIGKAPPWLNIALGYSATGMTGGSENVLQHNGQPIPEFDRTRQFFFTLDLDLKRIRTGSKTCDNILKAISFIKIPFPAIEINGKSQLRFHALYF